jgi:hypothetical protein
MNTSPRYGSSQDTICPESQLLWAKRGEALLDPRQVGVSTDPPVTTYESVSLAADLRQFAVCRLTTTVSTGHNQRGENE